MTDTNLVIISGRLGQDPKSFGSVTKLSIGTRRTYKKDGEEKEVTDWVPVTILEKTLAEYVVKEFKKGDSITIEGRVAETNYEKNGQKIYSTDIFAEKIGKVLVSFN